MSNAQIVFGLITLALTLGGGYMALRLKPLEDKDAFLAGKIGEVDTALDRRITAIHDDIKKDREQFEKRLGEIERSYLSRAELTAAIKDVRDNMDKGVDRLEAVVRALGVKVDHLAERLGKVEAS